MLRAARAWGSAQRQLCLAKMGMRDCHGQALCAQGQGKEVLLSTLDPDSNTRDAGVGSKIVYFKHSKEHTGHRHKRHSQVLSPGFPRAAPSGFSQARAVTGRSKCPMGQWWSWECGHGQEQAGGEVALREGQGSKRERRSDAEDAKGLQDCWWWV